MAASMSPLKITPLLASKVALLYDTSFIDTTYVDPVCFICIGFIHVENEDYPKTMICM